MYYLVDLGATSLCILLPLFFDLICMCVREDECMCVYACVRERVIAFVCRRMCVWVSLRRLCASLFLVCVRVPLFLDLMCIHSRRSSWIAKNATGWILDINLAIRRFTTYCYLRLWKYAKYAPFFNDDSLRQWEGMRER